MTPPDLDARSRALTVAAALGAVALAAVAAMLVIGRSYPSPETSLARSSDPTPTATAEQPRRPSAPKKPRQSGPQRLFAKASVWNRRLPAAAAIDPASASLVAVLASEVDREREAGTGPSIASGRGSTPLYRVGPRQRRVRVQLHASEAPVLRRALRAVPMPQDAEPADGPERRMTIWQPSTDRLWELSGAQRRADGWHARWGGAIRHVSTSRGYYDSAAWHGATPGWGATASGLPVIAGAILIDELRRGRIDHALAIGLPAARAGVFAWPAQRTDGTGPPSALPEGAWLRLDPQLDLRTLRLPRFTRMIARAAQRHGLIVREQTTSGISLFAEDPARLGANPYRRRFAGRTSSELLARFPWDRLQVLDIYYCWSAPCRRG